MAENRRKSAVSTYLLLFVLALVFAAAAVLLLPVYRSYQKKQAELGTLNEQLNDKRDESARLNTEVGELSRSPAAVEKVAREKFGLVKDGERVIKYAVPEKDRREVSRRTGRGIRPVRRAFPAGMDFRADGRQIFHIFCLFSVAFDKQVSIL